MECEMAAARESFASDVNCFCENHDLCSEARQTTQQHDTAADVEKLALELDQLETGRTQQLCLLCCQLGLLFALCYLCVICVSCLFGCSC